MAILVSLASQQPLLANSGNLAIGIDVVLYCIKSSSSPNLAPNSRGGLALASSLI